MLLLLLAFYIYLLISHFPYGFHIYYNLWSFSRCRLVAYATTNLGEEWTLGHEL